MLMKRTSMALAALATATLGAACAATPATPPAPEPVTLEVMAPQAALAEMNPTAGHEVRGMVAFTGVPGGLRVVATLTGLAPGQHGFHVHDKGDCSAPDGSSAGGHFNPSGHAHGLPGTAPRHAGDFGNVTANEAGEVLFDQVFEGLTLDGPEGILGRGLIVHANSDDGGQPTGNAGGRVACGVIATAAP